MPPNTFTTWDNLSRTFLNKYFSPGKMAKFKMDITNFSQLNGELLYEVWESFRDLFQKYPYHGLFDSLIVQNFYNDLSFSTKMTIDAATGGVLMAKSPQKTQSLIKEMAVNNYQ